MDKIKTDELVFTCDCIKYDGEIDGMAAAIAAGLALHCVAAGACETVAVKVLIRALALTFGAWTLECVQCSERDKIDVGHAQLPMLLEEEITKQFGSNEYRDALASLTRR